MENQRRGHLPAIEFDEIDESLGPGAVASALTLTLMSRLLVSRGAAALMDGGKRRVVAVHGGGVLRVGDDLADPLSAQIRVGGELPPGLAAAGYALAVPLRHGGVDVGLIALGERLNGNPFGTSEVSLARSISSAGAASVRAAGVAAELAASNRTLGRRAQELETLLELSEAFGRAPDSESILRSFAFGLMGNLLVSRFAIALPGISDATLDVAYTQGASLETLVIPGGLAQATGPVDLRDYPNLLEAGFTDSIPLRAGELTRGAVLVGPRAGTRHDEHDLERPFVASLCALAVGALEAADRIAERVEKELADEEVRIAREIQVGLLPRFPVLPAGLDVAVHWQPSRDVSGDSYELAVLRDGRLLVGIADVVGKGLGAALLMATLQSGLRMLRADLDDPSASLASATGRLNQLLVDCTEPHQFVTFAWAIVEPRRLPDLPAQAARARPTPTAASRDIAVEPTMESAAILAVDDADSRSPSARKVRETPSAGRVRYVCAGHPPPRLLRRDGTIGALEVGGPLLGVLASASFEEGEVAFRPGDSIAFYTDGLTEAADATGDEFGFERLDATLQSVDRSSPQGILDGMLAATGEFAADENADDETVLVVRLSAL